VKKKRGIGLVLGVVVVAVVGRVMFFYPPSK
jgi:hypothetical protein